MRHTQLAEADGELWHCQVCQWRCSLGVADVGRCRLRIGAPDGIVVPHDGLISAATLGMIDDYRFWHFLPGTPVLAIGGWGYAFPEDQVRGAYAEPPKDETKRRRLSPERAANFALERLCRGIVWAYGDPIVSHEYVLELMQLARASSRYTAIISSGFMTIEALDQIGHYLDGINLELRAFDDWAYTRLTGVEQWRGILDVAVHAQQRWGCHIEVTTRIHPGVNDSPDSLHAMAAWICEALGRDTVWHVLPGDAGSKATESVSRARRLAYEAGLRFVYGPDPHQPTTCPKCGALLIERNDGNIRIGRLEDGGCGVCGEELHIRTSIFKR